MIIIVITMTRQPLIIRLQLLTIRPTKLTYTHTTNHILIPFFLFLYLVTAIILQIKINRFYCRFYSVSINLFALIEFRVWLYVWEWYITAFLVLWGEGWLVFMVGGAMGILSLSAACFVRLVCHLIVIFIIVAVVIITRLSLATKPTLRPYHTILTFLLLVVIFHQQPITNTLLVSRSSLYSSL